MNKCIVVGIDAPLSPATQQVIHAIKEIIGPLMRDFRIILLHVIPMPYATSTTLSSYGGQFQASGLTQEQRLEAEKILTVVRKDLLGQASHSLNVEMCIRLGSPVDEIIKMAVDVRADILMIGSRGNRKRERIRRFFLGSKSRQVLQKAPCPVMIVSPLQSKPPVDLVGWYGKAITDYLDENTSGLTVFTSAEVAQIFAPPELKKKPGRKERAAAILALEQLAGEGILCRHDIQGEIRYVND